MKQCWDEKGVARKREEGKREGERRKRGKKGKGVEEDATTSAG
jgi:hypothetical protein